MPLSPTPTTLGTNTGAGGVSSLALSTSATVPSGGLIIVAVAVYLNGAAASNLTLSGGSLTWAKDAAKPGVTQANYYTAIFSAQAPAGLAASTSLTAALGSAGFNWHISGCYITGQATTSALDAAGAGGAGTTAGWSSGNVITSTADAFLFGVAHRDALTTSTAGGSFTELHDFQNGADSTTATTVYRVVSATGTYAASGTWAGGASEWVSQVAAYKQAGGGGGSTTNLTLSASAGSSAVMARQVNAIRACSSTSLAAIARQVNAIRACSAGSSATVVRRVNKILAATSTTVAAIASGRALTLTLTASSTAVASIAMVRARFATLVATCAVTAVLARQVNKTLSVSSAGNASLTGIGPGGAPAAPAGQRPTLGVG